MRLARRIARGVAAALLTLSACHAPPARLPRCVDAPSAPRRACEKAWTVLVAMTADTPDLAAPAARDLKAMEAAGSTARADVVVEIDRRSAIGVERLHVRHPASEPIEALPEPTSAPDERLAAFLAWGIDRYPAAHYAVIVWGHGLGYLPAGAPATSGGLAFDATRGAALDTPGLRRALAGAARVKLGGRPFDLYASDACLMQSVEVAGELAGVARFVVGSEQIEEDYIGLPYAGWLPLLGGSAAPPPSPACAPADDACLVAAALPAVQRVTAAHRDPPAPGFALSTVDEDALSRALLPALRRLGAAVDAYAHEDPLRRIGLRVLLGAEHGLRGTPGSRGGTRDLGVFFARLEAEVRRQSTYAGAPAESALLAAVADARRALGQAVIASEIGARYQAPAFEGMAGISVWLPHDVEEHVRRRAFFASSAPDRESPAFRGFLDYVFSR